MTTSHSKEQLLDAALRYAEMGYPVFPCAPGGKVPITPHGFKDATTDAAQIEAWWTVYPDANIGIPTAGFLVIDVDGADNPCPGDPDKAQDLARGPLSLTPSGGRHHIFRQPAGKTWKNTTGAIAPKVDTRANGGYIVVPPSVVDGKTYRWAETMELDAVPDQLHEPPEWLIALLDGPGGNGASPSDGNIIPSGQRNATLARLAGAMRRVGMSRDEILAGLKLANKDRCRPPLSAREVGRIADSIARYEPDSVAVAVVEDHYIQNFGAAGSTDEPRHATEDPGPVPDELLRVPGFVSEVMDHCLATAPYPNTVMAFCCALALQAVLAGRKVRDPGDNRTNLYLLGLAHSSAGKDRPRKLNTEILHAIGLSKCVGGRFASGEGVHDALFVEPCMLFQTDEIDGLLQSINKSKEARHEKIGRDKGLRYFTVTGDALMGSQSIARYQTIIGNAAQQAGGKENRAKKELPAYLKGDSLLDAFDLPKDWSLPKHGSFPTSSVSRLITQVVPVAAAYALAMAVKNAR